MDVLYFAINFSLKSIDAQINLSYTVVIRFFT